jgi:hypothetical protein
MKVIEKVDATATLAEYAAQIGNGPVIVTSEGRPRVDRERRSGDRLSVPIASLSS